MPGEEQLVRIDGKRLRITNLEKVLYPDTGTTKGEVIDYYTRVAPLLLPHVAGRPVTRIRWPDGVGSAQHPEPSFFAKDLERGAPSWVSRMPIDHSTGAKDYPLVENVPTLVYLAQVASLELHVPQWRFDASGGRGHADRLVLDLDPGPGAGLAECAIVAGWARGILADMGLDPYPVTSGSKGIHLYAALPPGQSTEQASSIAHELARAIEADHADLVVSSMRKSERDGKVLIDWSQNNGAKTTIAPYSLRGRARPTVAAPRLWEELDDPGLRHLLFDEVLERVASIGDPMTALGFHSGGRDAESGPLSTYISMRTAGRTPEPVPRNPLGESPHSDSPTFVIQEHHATALHWDFRLEHDGVLVSWAVPRGVPPSYTRNNLAIMTEDHPLSYGTFEGTIPAGEYGGGEVTIWDHGTYELEKWRDDEVIVTVDGQPDGPLGRVRLALIRTDGTGEKSTWLLHRMKTDAAGRPQRAGQPVAARGAATPQVASPDARAQRDAAPPEGPAAIEKPHSAREIPRHGVSERKSGVSPVSPLQRDLKPMLATTGSVGHARDVARRAVEAGGAAWVEFKWDGIRAIGVWDGARLRLFARSGTEVTARYPELTAANPGLGSDPAIIDGELVALDASGRPSFTRLQNRMNLTKPREIAAEAPRTPVRYYLFDVLSDSHDTTSLPLRERRSILDRMVLGASAVISAPPVFDDVDAALAASREFGLEGIVVKNPASAYRRGTRSEDWLKLKITHTQEVVIGGIRPGQGTRRGGIGSLLVGVPGPDGLQYAGRVGSGFSDKTLARLEEVLTRSDDNPFVGVPDADASDALWVQPDVVGEVEFAEFTPGGILRHSRWRGFRPDKSPAEVVREH